MEPELTDAVPEAPPSRRRRVIVGGLAVLVAVAMLASAWPDGPRPVAPTPAIAADPSTVTIVAGAPASIDPAKHGDLGSASYVSQLYETLTAVDTSLAIRPALAESWAVTDEGRKVTFTLRPGLEFSDGSPLRASDVVHSWRRLFIPGDPSPLASLIADVEGARELLSGASTDTTHAGRPRRGRPDGRRGPGARWRRPAGDRVGRPVRRRAGVRRRRRDHALAGQPGRERGLHAGARRPRSLRAQGQPALLGRQAGDRDREHAHDPRGPESRGRVRGR